MTTGTTPRFDDLRGEQTRFEVKIAAATPKKHAATHILAALSEF
jgi:hypothetical protein